MKINILKTEYRDIEELTPFQGELKTLSKADAKKLRKQIEEHGFIDPFIVWEHDGKVLILGGHQRQIVLYQMRADGETIPKLPCNFVECADEKQAKQIVLALTSQFGEITEKGLLDFSKSFDFAIADLAENFRFPEIDLGNMQAAPTKEKVESLVPFRRTHILLSFSPEKLIEIKPHLEKIIALAGVEYEQASN